MIVFSKRYKDLIDHGNGKPVDHICGEIDFKPRYELAGVMMEFDEPQRYQPSRYDNFTVLTDALESAIQRLNNEYDWPVAYVKNEYDNTDQQLIALLFVPYLFDLIEIQYDELSNSEKFDFQKSINNVLNQHDIPWLLTDGKMIKIDAKQFELDLKAKALLLLQDLKDSDPKFQSAYTELMTACTFFEKGDYSETIVNAEKAYESVLKVICELPKGNADKLTTRYIDDHVNNLPSTMTKEGFREKVLMSLPFLRNNSSSDHGAGEKTVVITKEFAKLAINLSATLCTYLIEEYMLTLSVAGTQDNEDTDLPF